MLAWIREEVLKTPVRCTPLIAVDLSDGLGLLDRQLVSDDAVGDCDPSPEMYTGQAFHELLNDTQMMAINNFYKRGHTFVGPPPADGSAPHRSRIDFVCAPKALQMHSSDATCGGGAPGRCERARTSSTSCRWFASSSLGRRFHRHQHPARDGTPTHFRGQLGQARVAPSFFKTWPSPSTTRNRNASSSSTKATLTSCTPSC